MKDFAMPETCHHETEAESRQCWYCEIRRLRTRLARIEEIASLALDEGVDRWSMEQILAAAEEEG